MNEITTFFEALVSLAAATAIPGGVALLLTQFAKDCVRDILNPSEKKMKIFSRIFSFVVGGLAGFAVFLLSLEYAPAATQVQQVISAVFLVIVPGLSAAGYYSIRKG